MGVGIASSDKSPKTPRAIKTSPRRVHFEDKNRVHVTTASEYAARENTRASSTSAPGNSTGATTTTANNNAQRSNTTNDNDDPRTSASGLPTSFPSLGLPPNAQQAQHGPDQWFTSANPAQSISQLPAGANGHSAQHLAAPFTPGLLNTPAPHPQHPNHPHYPIHFPPQFPTQIPSQFSGVAMAADYQNTAPLPHGVNFQPPVPDNSMGPMNHVYIPRFDGGLASHQVQGQPAFHVRLAPYQFIPTTSARPQLTSVLVPNAACQPPVGAFVSQQPGFITQPQPACIQQPVMMQGANPGFATAAPQYQAIPAAAAGGGGIVGGGGPPIIAGNTGPAPDVAGLGRTVGEEQLRQLNFAHGNKLFEPQDFKPSDDDPSRFYYVRELDGNWTQRNRFTIDHMGDCRWYVTDEGWFYAIRLPS